ncbi:acylneuraminate cytidylyltransferase [Sporosarcina sp. P7]|uniref:acylneuraminate cytidylyltransferase n=1 Tax=Sporosarcina sp. P7 TaxID=2048244 RepID=UPI000C16AC10|nr:acylneuraminate cytidylyltransferase [Sporosarcina sp. P7]PID23309.1 acylneuraminate cytidylyltransferase [Sporosarcina sp. P7]
MNENKMTAFIPVRGGSKSIPMKNIKLINSRPLVYWTIDAALNCELIDEVVVSTDSDEIARVVNNYDKDHNGVLKIINRDPANATDTASTESVLLEFISTEKTENVVLIQATSPLLQSEDLEKAIKKFNNEDYDSILSVVRQKRFIWEETENGRVKPINYSLGRRPRRQEFQGFLVENGAFYISSKLNIVKSHLRISGKIGLYEMPEESYYEIDEAADWMIIESLLKSRDYNNTYKLFKNIKLLALDCDGVLTDAGMYYSNEGDYLKKFNTKDGMGISLLKNAGIHVAIITGENSDIVKRRAEKLGIDDCILDCKDKVSAMDVLLDKYQLTLNEIAYAGDDINDLPLLKKVGASFSVQDALREVKQSVHYVTERKGGDGAVREIADIILSNRK